jgi:hypothetical protein
MKLENPATKGHATVAADPFWRELHDLLFQLRQLQMICRPDSGWHEEESRTSPFNAELKKTYEALSGGTLARDQSCRNAPLSLAEGGELMGGDSEATLLFSHIQVPQTSTVSILRSNT